jgi:hypothetical protein
MALKVKAMLAIVQRKENVSIGSSVILMYVYWAFGRIGKIDEERMVCIVY